MARMSIVMCLTAHGLHKPPCAPIFPPTYLLLRSWYRGSRMTTSVMHLSMREQARLCHSTRRLRRVGGVSRAGTVMHYVSTIRLEPGPDGELQVVITLGIADVL
ncbi:hypothetical protein H4582DRAFT_2058833 [Lactarius indigo]|nr:hypothetical protein H4582DRAFT_2058833 [Lactarius indigo]